MGIFHRAEAGADLMGEDARIMARQYRRTMQALKDAADEIERLRAENERLRADRYVSSGGGCGC